MPEAQSTPQRTPLEYGRPPGERRKVITLFALYGGIAIAFVLACAVIPAVWDHFENARLRAQFLALQQKCLSYSLPADQVVYDSSKGEPNVSAAWDEFHNTVSPIMSHHFVDTMAGKSVLFLHERNAPSGASFLICIEHALRRNDLFMGGGSLQNYNEQWANFVTPYCMGSNTFFITVIQSAAQTTRASEIPQTPPARPREFFKADNGIGITRIYAGQIDPNNRSHFTIRYQIGEVSDTIDGYIDNAGQVTLSQRSPPASAPALVPVNTQNYSDAN